MGDDQQRVRIALLKNELVLATHEAEDLGLELLSYLLRVALLETSSLLLPSKLTPRS